RLRARPPLPGPDGRRADGAGRRLPRLDRHRHRHPGAGHAAPRPARPAHPRPPPRRRAVPASRPLTVAPSPVSARSGGCWQSGGMSEQAAVGRVTRLDVRDGYVEISAPPAQVRVVFLTDDLLRIWMAPDGDFTDPADTAPPSGESGAGIVVKSDYPATAPELADAGDHYSVPFYCSTAGYGVFRNTYAPGSYRFTDPVRTRHEERRFDAYYFVGPPKQVIDRYTELTGRPFMPPIYGLEMGDADCYLCHQHRGERHTLDALQVADGYVERDIPLGWMLVNDRY